MMKDRERNDVKVKKEIEQRDTLAMFFLKDSFNKGNPIKIPSLRIEIRK